MDEHRNSVRERPTDTEGTTFKREGFPPPDRTGRDVDDLNEAGVDSVVRNIEPQPAATPHDDTAGDGGRS